MLLSNAFRQFFILLYKGALLRKRHYIVTIFEIIVPILLAIMLPLIYIQNCNSMRKYRPGSDGSKWKNATFYEPFDPYQDANYYSRDKLYFVYCPSDAITESFMNDTLAKYIEKSEYKGTILDFKGTDNEYELERYCGQLRKNDSVTPIIGTVFYGLQTKDGISDSLNYAIRYGYGRDYSHGFHTEKKYEEGLYPPYKYASEYRITPFISWQTAVEETFIQKKMEEKGQKLDYKVWMQMFPYPEYLDTSQFTFVPLIAPFLFYGYYVFIINLLRRLIEEKSNGSKELLKMMGMTDLVYWTSTFVNYFIITVVAMLVIAIVYTSPLQDGCVFLKGDFTLLFFMLLLYAAQFILFGMAFTVFFNKGIFGIIVYIIIEEVTSAVLMVQFFAGYGTDLSYMTLTSGQKLSICLIPMGTLQTIFRFYAFYDKLDERLVWNKVTDFSALHDVNMLMLIGMICLSCLLYVVIIWYFDKVWPWQPGVPKPFYFMFTKSYWNIVEPQVGDENNIQLKSDQDSEFFEVEPSGTSAGVVIKKLSKEFRTGFQTKLAVNDVSLNIFQGQITALLGHNGAGKTTTINILTGLYTPSSGTASINGVDILRNTTKARQGLGVCPQHNVLFDTLTTEEHLKIYAALKGVPWKELGTEAAKILDLLKLTVKKNDLAKTLSGGMKRKLSLGIAIIGGSKVLFLDEPTSGMDVEARRGVWDTLRDIRHECTIILTTHYMEEADILGDRIAIMAEGEIQCCGSSMFLKQKFGTGYHLNIEKGERFNLRQVTEFLEQYVPSATVESERDMEVVFKLSSGTDASFGKMFAEIENHKTEIGVKSYGITVTTMEDVFLNVANISDVKYKIRSEDEVKNTANGQMDDVLGASRDSPMLRRKPLLINQIQALLLKRLHYARRHWSVLVTQLVLPFVIMCFCLFMTKTLRASGKSSYNSLKLDISSVYGSSIGFYNAQKPKVMDVAESLKNVLESNSVEVNNYSDPTQPILELGKKDLTKYTTKFLVGGVADLMPDESYNLTAWYNGKPLHDMPMSLVLMHTALLKTIESSGTITVTNAPLPELNQNDFDFGSNQANIMAAVFVPLALAFLSASYVLLPVHERVSKAKLLQLMTGVHSVMYWITMFVWDFFVHFIVCLILIIPFAIFSHQVFFSPHSEAIGSALLLLLLYGWSSIPLSYLLSLVVKKGNTGFSILITISTLLGVGVVSIMASLKVTTGEVDLGSYQTLIDFIMWTLRFFPPFSVSVGFSNLFGIAYDNAFCESISKEDLDDLCYSTNTGPRNPFFKCCPNICGTKCLQTINPFTWEKKGSGRDMVVLAYDGILYFAILFLVESSIMPIFVRFAKQQIQKVRKRVSRQILQENMEDIDVAQEKERILNQFTVRADAGNEALIAMNLTKSFNNFYSVDHLTLGIHREECFGLLGVNGAGKTTTFRILTGDCHPDEGNAFIQQFSLTNNLPQFQSFLGYCPQFDALIDLLTGREMLTLFASLRGLTKSETEDQVNKMIKLTDLTKHADKQSRFYSGGNKRKLSIGMALIGFPPLILLDEPTAGVDPVSRRKIWNALSKARTNAGSAVILTTHSMEETEALCSRLVIMVNGQFRCLGSIQHIKSMYGQGYTLKIKMKREIQDNTEAVDAIKNHVQDSLRGSELKDEHQGMLQYQVVDTSVKLSHLFNFMSDMTSRFELEDYLISETTLEQIFLTFARSQRICK